MIALLKIIIILAVMAILAYPLLPLPSKAKKYATFYALRYETPHHKKNLFFVILAAVCFVLVAACMNLLQDLCNFLYNLPVLGNLFVGTKWLYASVLNLLGNQVNFILFVVTVVVVNAVILYSFVLIKGFLKKLILDRIFGIKPAPKEKKEKKPGFFKRLFKKLFGRKKKKGKFAAAESETPERADKKKNERVPLFEHSSENDETVPVENPGEKEDTPENESEVAERGEEEKEDKYNPVYRFFCGLLFEGDDYEYARGYTLRTRAVLQTFVYIIEAVYALCFMLLLFSVFFPLPTGFYGFFLNILHINEWYMYPFFSVVFLQEICNFLNAPAMPVVDEDEKKQQEEEEEDRRRDARLRALQSELKKRFDSEHLLRYYSETEKTKKKEYVCTNRTYASALRYIRKYMEEHSGAVMQSCMECLDAVYNDNHVYFAASFYSEFGEYLIAYTYIRLLSGARMIFIVSDPDKRESLKKYIRERLRKMTGGSETATWRVYTADERLDQADVLIASPGDFRDDNMVEQFPAFFEEASNAVFIDADRMIALDSYLCLIMARRLQRATDDRIRFIFLSLDWLKGFATGSLPKFFCVEKVLSFSSAAENEEVSYTLWQKESKSHRIYNKNGQKLTSLECILAELACEYDVDGVRLISEAPLGHAERKILALHNVEINNMYKDVADVNYMIYSDERCNLSAALYACMRFRGRKKSIVHILSKPYLLREYFMFKAAYEMYVNRSSFIQPRVTEHAERQKISLLRVFCDATADKGISVSEFETRMRDILAVALERGDENPSAFCRQMLADVENNVQRLRYKELAAYLVAGLYDEPDCPASDSAGLRAKDYYLVIDPNKQDGYALYEEKFILFNRVKDIFDKLLVCNRRVSLCLNDEVIGQLDTFPTRVHREYLAGQSIIYNNAEYEIEHIAEDGSAIFLRSENTNIKNCLDTILLRRYQIESIEQVGQEGVLHSTKSPLEEIRVAEQKISFVGETYGFYSLMTDRQTLDFYRGVEGNPHVAEPSIRPVRDGRALRVTLISKTACTDGMRLLLAAVFNEFIRTIFPQSYHCIAICPILKTPLPFDNEHEPISEIERISALYPYLKTPGEDFIENEEQRMQFLFLNDCEEDIGALDWFYDKAARYMQEFLANVYSYLHWLQKNAARRKHYIYFGGDALPECYDLDGCCALLEDFNLLLSDEGLQDFETAGKDEIMEETERCSFCHRIMDNGRYSRFDDNRFICAECFNTIDTQEKLEECLSAVLRYLSETYPDIRFGKAQVDLDSVYELSSDQILSEFYYRLDADRRMVLVERDSPETNAEVSILRGIVELWQTDNDLLFAYARAQLYFEELMYLKHIGKDESAQWIYENLPEDVHTYVDEIADFVGTSMIFTPSAAMQAEAEDSTLESGENLSTDKEETSKGETSFSFMRMKAKELEDEDVPQEDFDLFEEDEKTANRLYDPNKVPRFWKRYLRNEQIDNKTEEELPPVEDDPDGLESPEEGGTEGEAEPILENSPPPGDIDDPAEEPAEKPAEAPAGESDEEAVEESDEEITAESDEEEPAEETTAKSVEEPSETPVEQADDKKNKKKKKEKEKKEKKKNGKESFLSRLFKSKKKTDAAEEDPNRTGEGQKRSEQDKKRATKGEKEEKAKKKAKKLPEKRRNRNGEPVGLFGKLSPGEKIVPYEDDEATNPKIRFYNELARNFFNYSDEPIPRAGLSDMDVLRIFQYVRGDYPEIFWVSTYSYTPESIVPQYRCLDAKGRVDKKQINEKRMAIRKGAKRFTAGITRRTDPYTALLTLYRRLILTLDYDGRGLDAGVGEDMRKDDSLRSLYSALVEHKVVCAGYAAAMQYLMQSIGLVSGYVISETDKSGMTHAFNIVKLGKEVYYLDATWGDYSNTKTGDEFRNAVFYNYFCAPYKEFTMNGAIENHIPRKELYPTLETFRYTTHEYFRYHKAYLTKYNEEEIVRIFADAALAYKAKNGDFIVGIRFIDKMQMEYASHRLVDKGELSVILAKAFSRLKKKHKAAERFELGSRYLPLPDPKACTLYFLFPDVEE